ncbi:MAG TPA: CRTAC1 family protein [Phycisphaerales bacterium]|nr:CRTAC1 family protein [Phycisphaerales bacterium]
MRTRAHAALAVVLTASAVAVAQPTVPFTEEAAVRGINFQSLSQAPGFGQGVAFVDLDSDGDADLVALRPAGVLGLYQNNGQGIFTDRSVNLALSSMAGISSADFDADGDMDLFITRWFEPNVFLRNDGNYVFVNIAPALGLNERAAAMSSCWGDYNSDGYPDLYVANRTLSNDPLPPFGLSMTPNRLYRNNGGGSFTEVAGPLGVSCGQDQTLQAAWFDYDKDGDVDLYISNDHGASACFNRNRLFRNDGPAGFVNVSAASGTDGCIDAMCIALGDFDNNRFQDIYVTNTPAQNYLYMSQANGTFLNRAVEAGVASYATGWGSSFVDIDNDGRLDLYVANMAAPNRMYWNPGSPANWPCPNLAQPLGLALNGYSFGTAIADVDADGDMDLALSSDFYQLQGPGRVRLYINQTNQSASWARFRIVGTGANRNAIGALIEVRTGSTWQIRSIVAGDSYKSQSEFVAHFGLGGYEAIDELVVRWPGGTVTRTVRNLPARGTWTVTPPAACPADANGDGLVSTPDVSAFLSNWFADIPGRNLRSDINNLGGITTADITAFLSAWFAALAEGGC